MWSFARPSELTLDVEKKSVDGACGYCGDSALASYPVVSDGGWWNVVKCTVCLRSVSRERGPRLGIYTPQGADVEVAFQAALGSAS